MKLTKKQRSRYATLAARRGISDLSEETPSLTLFNINDTNSDRIYFTSTAGITFTSGDFTTSSAKTVSSVTEVGGGSYYLTMSAAYVSEDVERVTYAGADADNITSVYVFNDSLHSKAGTVENIAWGSAYWAEAEPAKTHYIRVKYPDSYKLTKDWPTVFSIQGAGQDSGPDGLHEGRLTAGGPLKALADGTLPTEADEFLLFTLGNITVSGKWSWNANVETALYCLKNFPCDLNRCCVTGISRGGQMTVDFSRDVQVASSGDLLSIPRKDMRDYFSHFALCAAGYTGGQIADLQDTDLGANVIIIHGSTDSTFTWASAKTYFQAGTAETGQYTKDIIGVTGVGHDVSLWQGFYEYDATYQAFSTEPETTIALINFYDWVKGLVSGSGPVATDRMQRTLEINTSILGTDYPIGGLKNVPLANTIKVRSLMHFYDSGGTILKPDADMSSYIELKLTNDAGAAVPFTAVLTDYHNITITPSSSLGDGTLYYVEFNGYDVDSNVVTKNVTFNAGNNKFVKINCCESGEAYNTDNWNDLGGNMTNGFNTVQSLTTTQDTVNGYLDDEDGVATTIQVEVTAVLNVNFHSGSLNGLIPDSVANTFSYAPATIGQDGTLKFTGLDNSTEYQLMIFSDIAYHEPVFAEYSIDGTPVANGDSTMCQIPSAVITGTSNGSGELSLSINKKTGYGSFACLNAMFLSKT